MRILYHIPPFQKFSPTQCLLCHLHSHQQPPNLHFLLCPQNKQITFRFIHKSDQDFESGKLRCSNPIKSINNFQNFNQYFSTCLYEQEPFTNENIENILKTSNKNAPIDPSRNNKVESKFPQRDAMPLLRSFNPQHEVSISMDGSSFPSSKKFPKRRAGCCARVFPPGKNYGYENPIFLGDQDSLYAELYSFISTFEILHCLIEQQKIIPQTKFHFLTDSKEARYFLLSIAPPEKYPQLVLFIRNTFRKMLKDFCYEIHWIPGHVGIGVHERTHRCAQAAAKYFNKIPKFPPIFEISVFAKGPEFYVTPECKGWWKKELPTEIYPPPLSGNTSLLISKFLTNYIISHPQTIPKIEQTWFDHFDRSRYAPPPPWKNNHTLVTALRTPYIVTHNLYSTPRNALGWAYYQNNPELPEFGFFEPGSACNQLFLYVLTEHEIKFLHKKIEQTLQANTVDPWRIAFFIVEKDKKYLREFPNTISTTPATFTVGTTTIHLHYIESTLAHALDPPMYSKLNSWIQQFSHHKINIPPDPSSTSRRSIQSYFQPELRPNSTILSQSYMQYLQPYVSQPSPHIDPTINLIGFHPHFKLHISELKNGNSLMQQMYKNMCYKYDKIKKLLAA